jgi:hypothetical protein
MQQKQGLLKAAAHSPAPLENGNANVHPRHFDHHHVRAYGSDAHVPSAQHAVSSQTQSWLQPKVTLSVEGNISAGKSTFLRILDEQGLLNSTLHVGAVCMRVSTSRLNKKAA